MTKKYISNPIMIILFYFLFSPILQSQTIDSNKHAFTKAFIKRTSKGAVLKVINEVVEGEESLYFDNENNIVKYISDFEYPDSRFLVAASYNLSGNLYSVIFRFSVPEGTSCRGAATISYDASNDPTFDWVIYYSKDYGEWQVDTNRSTIFTDVCEEFDIQNYINTSTLIKIIDLKDIIIPYKCEKVAFRRPQKGDDAMLNAVDAGCKVRVIDVETNDDGIRRYKVEYKGKYEYFPESALENAEYNIDN